MAKEADDDLWRRIAGYAMGDEPSAQRIKEILTPLLESDNPAAQEQYYQLRDKLGLDVVRLGETHDGHALLLAWLANGVALAHAQGWDFNQLGALMSCYWMQCACSRIMKDGPEEMDSASRQYGREPAGSKKDPPS